MSVDSGALQSVLAGVGEVENTETLQQLWGGYGDLLRVYLRGGTTRTVIVKQIAFPPPEVDHPQGWQSDFAHQRKLASYRTEAAWYRHYAAQCTVACYCPELIKSHYSDTALWLVMEDLGADYPVVTDRIELAQVRVCLSWLAHFHARFMSVAPNYLWAEGTYWNLTTRPDELTQMAEGQLKTAAVALDNALNTCTWQTLVHGDAKLANFCFSLDGTQAAAVDFQYVGGGCGMKDVICFFTSCLTETDCFEHETALLDYYFVQLTSAMSNRFSAGECAQAEAEWRQLYVVAWADLDRFLCGWSPRHWKRNLYMQVQTDKALAQLKD